MKYLLLVAMLCSTVNAQEHKFWDRRQKVDFMVTSGIRAADAAITCKSIAGGGQERWLPVKSCAGVSLWMAGSQTAQLGFGYFLHKKGWHKAERWMPYINVSQNVVGIGFTLSHWPKKKTPVVGESYATPVEGIPCRTYWEGSRWVTRCY